MHQNEFDKDTTEISLKAIKLSGCNYTDSETKFADALTEVNYMVQNNLILVSINLNGESRRVVHIKPHGIRQQLVYYLDEHNLVKETSVPRFFPLQMQMRRFDYNA